MPNPGTVNNPGGVNGVDAFGAETPYGQVKRNEQMTKSAPFAAAPALDAPRRAKRAAAKPAPVAPPPVVPQPAHVVPGMAVAQAWAQIAQTPGASPLVQQLAAQAMADGV